MLTSLVVQQVVAHNLPQVAGQILLVHGAVPGQAGPEGPAGQGGGEVTQGGAASPAGHDHAQRAGLVGGLLGGPRILNH